MFFQRRITSAHGIDRPNPRQKRLYPGRVIDRSLADARAACARPRQQSEPVFSPAAVDELLDLAAHSKLFGPVADDAFAGNLAGGIDADLAPEPQ